MLSHSVGSYLGIHKRTEVLLMIIGSVLVNVFDMSLLELSSNIDTVMGCDVDPAVISSSIQMYIKNFLYWVVVIRTFLLHINIVLSLAILWPVIMGEKAVLILPWLLVSGVKNVATGVLCFFTGIYICFQFGMIRPACIQFTVTRVFDVGPSIYMWLMVLSYYRDLTKPKAIDAKEVQLLEQLEMDVAVRRRKVKSMADEAVLRKQIEGRSLLNVYFRRYTGTSAVVMDDFKPFNWETMDKKMSRSLDSLLELMAAEAEDMDPDDSDEVPPLEDGLTTSEKTVKLLGLTFSEIDRARTNRRSVGHISIPLLKAHPKSTCLSDRINKVGSIGITTSKAKNRLLVETSLYTPTVKPVRATKSELKSPKEFLKLKSPSDFMDRVPEKEVRIVSLHTRESGTISDSHSSSSSTEKLLASENYENRSVSSIDASERNRLPSRIKAKFSSKSISRSSQDSKIPLKQKKSSPRSSVASSSSIDDKKKNAIGQEVGVQASTLSRRILNSPPAEMTKKLSYMEPLAKKRIKTRTIAIKPPTSKEIVQNVKYVDVPKESAEEEKSFAIVSTQKSDIINQLASDRKYVAVKYGLATKQPYVDDGYTKYLTEKKENSEKIIDDLLK